jgi:hypothetical protein
MTTETIPTIPKTKTARLVVTDEVVEDLRALLTEALRSHASLCAQSSEHLEELGDADAARGETGIALLSAWLADNVRAWTHTTRLREGLVKFDPIAAAEVLATVLDDEQLDENDPEWRP